jgi:DNA repair protein RadA/Sms
MAKARTSWNCTECGYAAPRWLGKCPECGAYGTLEEKAEAPNGASASSRTIGTPARTFPLDQVRIHDEDRTPTGIPEFDRVLGGGLVAGSLVLLGGEPGIGKSTLLLQAAAALESGGGSVLYVCGEESPAQVRIRADRVAAGGASIAMLPEVDVSRIEATALETVPSLLVVDSIQTVYDPDVTGAPGSVTQVRASTARLMRLAKDHGITTIVVGHVTKEGAIAGPRVLEHMVDAVLYFEGDRDHAFRIVRSVKNRFGASDEIGVFEMTSAGLKAVDQPSAMLVGQRAEAPGSAITAAMEGSRAVLVEVQALVAPSYLQMPRRLANGMDTGRLLQVLAVLERHAGLPFGQHDVYVAVSGGMKLAEPGADLPLALALISARTGAPLPRALVAFGEIGLTGEIRGTPHLEARLRESARLGFEIALTGAGTDGGARREQGIPVERLRTVADLPVRFGRDGSE